MLLFCIFILNTILKVHLAENVSLLLNTCLEITDLNTLSSPVATIEAVLVLTNINGIKTPHLPADVTLIQYYYLSLYGQEKNSVGLFL